MARSAYLIAILTFIAPATAQVTTEPTTRELLSISNERDLRYNQRFDAQEKAVAAALAAAKEAVVKAEGAAEKRFDSVNEFRGQLKDQALTFATRSEVDIRLKGLEEKIAVLQERQTRDVGRTEGIDWVWGAIGAVAGLVVGAAGLFFGQKKMR